MKAFVFFLFIFYIFNAPQNQVITQTISPENAEIQYTGRFDFSNLQQPKFAWSGSQITFTFEGSFCNLLMQQSNFEKDKNGNELLNYFNIFIDKQLPTVLKLEKGKREYELAKNLAWGKHTITIFKRTEGMVGVCEFLGFQIDAKGKVLASPAKPKRKVEFIGDSITCGYGNEGESEYCKFTPETENAYLSYAAISARELGAEYTMVCYSGKGVIQNYNKNSKDIMPELYERINPQDSLTQWNFGQWTPDAVVINLGTNDFAHEIPDSTRFTLTYSYMISRVLTNHPKASVFCLVGSMLNGEKLDRIKNYLKQVVSYQNKKGNQKVYFFEMSTQGKLGYGCDWHPNVPQNQQNAKELTRFVKEKMGNVSN